jgi:hypothetical protein
MAPCISFLVSAFLSATQAGTASSDCVALWFWTDLAAWWDCTEVCTGKSNAALILGRKVFLDGAMEPCCSHLVIYMLFDICAAKVSCTVFQRATLINLHISTSCVPVIDHTTSVTNLPVLAPSNNLTQVFGTSSNFVFTTCSLSFPIFNFPSFTP